MHYSRPRGSPATHTCVICYVSLWFSPSLTKEREKNYEKLVSESETVLCHNYLHSRKLSGDHNDVLTPVGRGIRYFSKKTSVVLQPCF